jgi:hypothetical protein
MASNSTSSQPPPPFDDPRLRRFLILITSASYIRVEAVAMAVPGFTVAVTATFRPATATVPATFPEIQGSRCEK